MGQSEDLHPTLRQSKEKHTSVRERSYGQKLSQVRGLYWGFAQEFACLWITSATNPTHTLAEIH